MKEILKKYDKKNKITGIIALILICLFLSRITYGISIILLIFFFFIKFDKSKKVINESKERMKKKHDEINNK